MKTRLSFIMAGLVLLLAVSCGSGGSRASLAQEGFAQGEQQMAEGRYDEAVLSLTQAGEIQPKPAEKTRAAKVAAAKESK